MCNYKRGVITLQQSQKRGKTVPFTIEVPENVRDKFREDVEKNGKTVDDVLKLYMQKYIWKQGELQKNRQRRRLEIG
jgi:hypothetical protein